MSTFCEVQRAAKFCAVGRPRAIDCGQESKIAPASSARGSVAEATIPAHRESSALKFAIIGAGAIGGYLGAKLALAGEEVTFLVRGANLDAIGNHGIKLIAADG